MLPAVPNDNLLTLGIPVEEGRVSVRQWREDCAAGQLTEVFGCGTAAVVTPVGTVKSTTGEFTVGDGATGGPVTLKLREHLMGIQNGTVPDRHDWLYPIKV